MNLISFRWPIDNRYYRLMVAAHLFLVNSKRRKTVQWKLLFTVFMLKIEFLYR